MFTIRSIEYISAVAPRGARNKNLLQSEFDYRYSDAFRI